MGTKARRLDKDRIYIGSDLYLPKESINVQYIKNVLTLKDGRKSHKLYKELKDHIVVPRYHLNREELEYLDCPIEILGQQIFPETIFDCKITLRDNQTQAYQALLERPEGILNLSPGKGKTVLALKLAAELKVPVLVTVNTELLLNQWARFIKEFLNEDDVGVIQGPIFDWKHKITLSMIQTLYSVADDLPEDFRNYFGLHIVDEGHHLGGIEFGKIGPICKGRRLLLSATYKRVDGREDIIKQFFGDVIYSDKSFDLKPEIVVVELPTTYESDEHPERLTSLIATDKTANLNRAKVIKEYSKDRKSILVSTRVDQLHYLKTLFPKSCVITSTTPKDERIELIDKSPMSFIIDNFGVEALDCPALDTLFILMPIPVDKKVNSDKTVTLLGNNIQQIMGRILREHKSKKPPLVIIFDDKNVSVLNRQVSFMKTWLDNNKYSFRVEKFEE